MAGTFSLDRTFDGSDEENGEIDLYEIWNLAQNAWKSRIWISRIWISRIF